MDRPGDQLLAGPRLAANQHRRVALRDLFHDRQDGLQRAAGADDAVELVDVLLRVPQVLDFVLQTAVLDGLFDLELHLLDFERLLHVVECADLHRLDGGMDRTESGHQNDGGRRVQRLRGPEDVQPVAAAHLQIAEDDVVLPFVELFNRDVAVGRLFDLVMRVRKRPYDAPPQRIVVVRHQNPAHINASSSSLSLAAARSVRSRPAAQVLDTQCLHRNSACWLRTGSVTRNTVPPPARALTSIRPSWASTILRTIASPSPEPCGFVVKNGLKIRSITSGGTPGPVSLTSSCTIGPCSPVSSSVVSIVAAIRTSPLPPSASNALINKFVKICRS